MSHVVRPAINIAKFDPNTLDITFYLDVAHQEIIAVVLSNMGTVAGWVSYKVRITTSWDEFHTIVIQTVQPSLETVAALTQLQTKRYKDNLNTTLEDF